MISVIRFVVKKKVTKDNEYHKQKYLLKNVKSLGGSIVTTFSSSWVGINFCYILDWNFLFILKERTL